MRHVLQRRPGEQQHEVGLARLDVAVALAAGDAAGLLECAKRVLQFLLTIRRQTEESEQFRDIGRDVIPPAKKFQNLIFHKFTLPNPQPPSATVLGCTSMFPQCDPPFAKPQAAPGGVMVRLGFKTRDTLQ